MPIRYLEAKFSILTLESMPADKMVSFCIDEDRGRPKGENTVSFQTLYVKAYTAEIMGTRNKEGWTWRNTMTKLFLFHRNLLLEDIGELVLGIVAHGHLTVLLGCISDYL